jgi:WD40 repeat protein
MHEAAWSPDGRSVATAADDALVRIWEVATGRVLRVLTGHTKEVYVVAWSPDGKALVSAGHEKPRIWVL